VTGPGKKGAPTTVDTATARKRLEVMLEDLDRSIAILTGESPEPGGSAYDQHPADAGTSLSDADRSEAALQAMERQRSVVLAALQRLDEGRYGQCVGCGKPVPEGRLEARPDAARCVACQSQHDKSLH
jgi:DnaK suppressor protein